MTIIQISSPIVFLLVLNLISLTVYGVDKLKSVRKKRRISELNLLSLALLAPFGAYIAMLLFRHKTRKPKFLLVPIFLIIQLGLIIHYHLI